MLFDIQHRSLEPELMDLAEGSQQEFERNFKEIEAVNYWLGSIRLTRSSLKEIIKGKKIDKIVDVGCGSGDILLSLANDMAFHNIQLIGIDNNPGFLSIAERNAKGNYTLLQADILEPRAHIPDASIYMFNMMLHHFSEDDIIHILRSFYRKCSIGLLINDLNRNYLAKVFIWTAARVFGTSRQFRNDAPLSVAKGFTYSDWERIIKKCGFKTYSIRWDVGFRHIVKVYK